MHCITAATDGAERQHLIRMGRPCWCTCWGSGLLPSLQRRTRGEQQQCSAMQHDTEISVKQLSIVAATTTQLQ
jgi:hypothetical protein